MLLLGCYAVRDGVPDHQHLRAIYGGGKRTACDSFGDLKPGLGGQPDRSTATVHGERNGMDGPRPVSEQGIRGVNRILEA